MLPVVYSDYKIAEQIVEDPSTAPIPNLHKAMFAWVKKFTRNSWDLTASDIQTLRDVGIADSEIGVWAQFAAAQSVFVMMGDGGGVTLDDGNEVGAVVGRDRPTYNQAEGGLLASAPGSAGNTVNAAENMVAWIVTDEACADFQPAAVWAKKRYGFVPNLLKSISSDPIASQNMMSAFELLEAPQSETLSPRQHALVRALVSDLNRCAYSAVTTRALLQQFKDGDGLYEKVTGPWNPDDWNQNDRLVLSFAIKTARNAYKIVESDAQEFRDAGLGDEGYVDVLNTVALQTAYDRMANSLGVVADDSPVLTVKLSAA